PRLVCGSGRVGAGDERCTYASGPTHLEAAIRVSWSALTNCQSVIAMHVCITESLLPSARQFTSSSCCAANDHTMMGQVSVAFVQVLAHWLTMQLTRVNGTGAGTGMLAAPLRWSNVSLSSVSFRTFNGFAIFFIFPSCSRAARGACMLLRVEAGVELLE